MSKPVGTCGSEKMDCGKDSMFTNGRREISMKDREEVAQELERIVESIEKDYIRPNEYSLLSWLREWLRTYAKPTLRPAIFTNYEINI